MILVYTTHLQKLDSSSLSTSSPTILYVSMFLQAQRPHFLDRLSMSPSGVSPWSSAGSAWQILLLNIHPLHPDLFHVYASVVLLKLEFKYLQNYGIENSMK